MNTISAYISAALLEVEYAAEVAEHLAELGIASTARWIDGGSVIDPDVDSVRAKILTDNCEDIRRATCCVFLAHVGTPRAGHWDAAYALLTGKKLFWVQDGELGRNVWDTDPNVHRISAGSSARQTAIKLESAISRELGGGKR